MTKLLPFDLEAAKAGAKVVTRDGRPARIVCWDGDSVSRIEAVKYPLVVLIDRGDSQFVALFSESGGCLAGVPSLDLFMLPTPVKRWRVIYRGEDDNAAQRDFETLREANDFCEYRSNTAAPYEVEIPP